jgi:hypothetical protein
MRNNGSGNGGLAISNGSEKMWYCYHAPLLVVFQVFRTKATAIQRRKASEESVMVVAAVSSRKAKSGSELRTENVERIDEHDHFRQR